MNLIDVISILIILLFGVIGLKRGVIRSLVQLVGTCAVLVLAFVFKDVLAGFLMKYLPFFDFGGIFQGISSINILIYELLSFIVIYILMYCVLSIIINLAGLVEKLLDLTVILAIPSKILGGIVGLIEGIIMAFLITFILFHIPVTEPMVADSKFSIVLLERTPIIGKMAAGTTQALEKINTILEEMDENADREDVNFQVLHTLVYYNIISKDDAQKLIDDGKIVFSKTVVI